MATAAHTRLPELRATWSMAGCWLVLGDGVHLGFTPEQKPLAHVLAAAPDLLAALQALLGSFESEAGIIGAATIDRARVAIAKATGEP